MEFNLDAAVKHYENPRNEDKQYNWDLENSRFLELVGGQKQALN